MPKTVLPTDIPDRMPPRDLLRPADVPLHYPFVSTRAVYGWIERHVVPFHRIGRRLYISRTDIDAVIAAGRVEAKPSE